MHVSDTRASYPTVAEQDFSSRMVLELVGLLGNCTLYCHNYTVIAIRSQRFVCSLPLLILMLWHVCAGKGRQIAGIMADNFYRGRKKHVWISASTDLYHDAKRDLADISLHINLIKGLQQLDAAGKKALGMSADFKEVTTAYSRLS